MILDKILLKCKHLGSANKKFYCKKETIWLDKLMWS